MHPETSFVIFFAKKINAEASKADPHSKIVVQRIDALLAEIFSAW